MRRVAKLLGYSCLVVEPVEDKPGIVALVSSELARAGVNIVQIVAEDPHIYPRQKLYVIAESDIPGEVVKRIATSPLIESVTLLA